MTCRYRITGSYVSCYILYRISSLMIFLLTMSTAKKLYVSLVLSMTNYTDTGCTIQDVTLNDSSLTMTQHMQVVLSMTNYIYVNFHYLHWYNNVVCFNSNIHPLFCITCYIV